MENYLVRKTGTNRSEGLGKDATGPLIVPVTFLLFLRSFLNHLIKR
jgi:hypothetical protein